MAPADPVDASSPRRLSLPIIVEATLALMDDEGIAAATMRAVGARLNVQGMSLYRYVANREELLDLVVEKIVDELFDDAQVQQTPADGWRPYLTDLANGVRRYALRHPHVFPLVATRPPKAPWLNPPLRSLRWVESMLAGLGSEGFTDDEVLFAYRAFNGFLLGYLLLETSAIALNDPKPGDGSFQAGTSDDGSDPVNSADPVPGGYSPTRTRRDRQQLGNAESAAARHDPTGSIDADRYPTVTRLQAGLTEDHFADEFAAGLADLLDRVDRYRN